MASTHQTQIIKIGNSNGIRIPKEYLQSFETKNVMINLVNNSLVITPITSKILPRASWDSIMSKMSVDNENDFSDFDITLNDGLDDL